MWLHVFLSLRKDDAAENDICGVLIIENVLRYDPHESPLAAGQYVSVPEADHGVLVKEHVRHAFVRSVRCCEEIPAVIPRIYLDASEKIVGAYPEAAQRVFRH